ncbi:MAG: hypothetical protein Q9165_006736 [Trypethelium subeluteriae]
MSVKKAAFSAAFLRADPTPVAKDSLASFHDELDEVISKGTNTSVQKCKLWLVENAVPSESRVIALGKYLTSLSLTVTPPEPSKKDEKPANLQTSLRKKRIHLLYLINDLLHHTKYHAQQTGNHAILTARMKLHLPELMRDAASFDASKNKKLHQKLHDIISIWEDNNYYIKEFCNTLHQIAESAGKVSGDSQARGEETGNATNSNSQIATNVPLALPSTHGDRTAHWSDLPTGCTMQHVARNSTRPIKLREMRQLELNSRSAEPAMVEAIKWSLIESGQIRNPYPHYENRIIIDTNAMGQSPYLNNSDVKASGSTTAASYTWLLGETSAAAIAVPVAASALQSAAASPLTASTATRRLAQSHEIGDITTTAIPPTHAPVVLLATDPTPVTSAQATVEARQTLVRRRLVVALAIINPYTTPISVTHINFPTRAVPSSAAELAFLALL